MKSSIIILAIMVTLTVALITHSGLITKEVFLETIWEAIPESVCSEAMNQCFGVTFKIWEIEIKSIFDSCIPEDLPDEVEYFDEVRDFSTEISRCTYAKYTQRYKNKMNKNIGTTACKNILEWPKWSHQPSVKLFYKVTTIKHISEHIYMITVRQGYVIR